MDFQELKKEQYKLASKISLQDTFDRIKTIGAASCTQFGGKLIACVVVCEFPSFELKEKATYILHNPLPHRPGFEAYQKMPAIIEAFNQLEQEPDILLVLGNGILHPRRLGIASHLGLALNLPTIGVSEKLVVGKVDKGNIMYESEIRGFVIKTREHSNPVYVSPGHKISLGSVLNIIPKTIKYPHKLPEPLHIARKVVKKKGKNGLEKISVL